MTRDERFEKAKAALLAALAGDDEGALMLIVASPKPGDAPFLSVLANMPDEGKKHLLRDVLHLYEHGQLEHEALRRLQ